MLQVKDIMTREVFSLKRTDSLRSARSLMSLVRVRHIPIVEAENTFIGLITHRDILSATISKFAEVDADIQDEIDSGIPIDEIMRGDVATISPDTTLKDAAEILLNNKYGCLPVVEDAKLVGIITEADFLKLTIRFLEGVDQG